MDKEIPVKSSTLISWLLLISGTSTYVIGLGMACPSLSGKGYFLSVLTTAIFVTYAYLREEKGGQLDDGFVTVCQMVALITLGLFLVGILNAPLSLRGRGLYTVAFFVGLLGFVRLIRVSGH
nr:inner membrane protein YiaB [Citrobacter sp. ku-bf4]